MYQEGQTATHKDGRKIEFRNGAWRLLEGGGGAGGATTGGQAAKLTEDQGKSQTYGRLMATAERQYDAAVRDGYNYASPINALSRVIEQPAPLIGAPLAPLAPVLRGPAADRAVGAERAWQDAQLKAMTGAGQNQLEAAEAPRTYFPQFGESPDTAVNKREMRSTAYDAVKRRAGPAGDDLPAYPQELPPAVRAATRRMHAAGRIDEGAPFGSERNPYVARDQQTLDRLPPGSYVITPEGHFGVVE